MRTSLAAAASVILGVVILSCGGTDSSETNSILEETFPAGEITSEIVASTKNLGYVSTGQWADVTRCVPDAENVLTRLNARGDLLGFHYGHANYTSLGGGTSGEKWHAQGVVRLPFLTDSAVLDGSYFVSTFSHPQGSGADYGPHLGVAHLGFKGGNSGKVIGTNRACNYNWTGPRADWDVTPNSADTFVPVNGTSKFRLHQVQNHPGGISTIGWHVVVPLQKWDGDTLSDSVPLVQLWDFGVPEYPVMHSEFQTRINGSATSAMAATATKLANSRFLLAVIKDSPVGRVEYYLSPGTNINSSTLFGTNNRLPDAYWPHNPGWQNMKLITDCNSGEMYLLGLGSRGSWPNYSDWLELYHVEFYSGGTSPDAPYRVAMTKIGDKQMYCSDNHDTDQCDFNASAGVYVDPNGRVLIYATEPIDDGGATSWVYGNGVPWCYSNTGCGTYAAYGDFLRGVEFHERHGNAAADSACPTMADAWVEMYQNPTFNNQGGDNGHYYHIRYESYSEKNAKNLGTNSFNDKATSIRWCLPPGSSFRVWRDSWTGSYHYLNGTGTVRQITDLNAYTYRYGGGSMNDSITSYWFYNSYADPYGLVGSYDYGN